MTETETSGIVGKGMNTGSPRHPKNSASPVGSGSGSGASVGSGSGASAGSGARTRYASRAGRRRAGMSFVEVAATSFFVIVFAALGVEIALLIFAASVNDGACRNAARAAAQGSDYAKSLALARAAVKSSRTDGYFISQPTITNFQYQTFGGNPPANETPYVQVRTEVTVKLPVKLFFFGANFNAGNDMVFKQMYSYPIVKTKILMP